MKETVEVEITVETHSTYRRTVTLPKDEYDRYANVFTAASTDEEHSATELEILERHIRTDTDCVNHEIWLVTLGIEENL